MPNDLFDNDPSPSKDDGVLKPDDQGGKVDYLKELVGDDKKFKTADDLARGKHESDRFIEKLQSELREMRDELNQRLSLEDTLKKIEQSVSREPASNPPEPRVDEGDEDTAKGLTEEQVTELVQKSLSQEKERDTQTRNIEYVRNELRKRWGQDFVDKMHKRTEEVGLGKDFATGLAASQPKAFLELMIGHPVDQGNSAPPRSTQVSSTSFRASHGAQKYKDYERMRKEDPKQYFSTATQMRMHKDAIEQGESFYE
jgi:hypothetical protein